MHKIEKAKKVIIENKRDNRIARSSVETDI
jgi:hypothetical protein